VIVVAAAPDWPARGEQGEVGGRVVRARTAAAEGRDRDPHERGVPRELGRRIHSDRREPPWVFALENDVDETDQRARQLPTARSLDVERDATLARVVVPERQAALRVRMVAGERSVPALRAAVRRLQQPYVCAGVREELSGECRPLVRQLQHPYAFERSS